MFRGRRRHQVCLCHPDFQRPVILVLPHIKAEVIVSCACDDRCTDVFSVNGLPNHAPSGDSITGTHMIVKLGPGEI